MATSGVTPVLERPLIHGKASTYNHGCHCDPCREAHRIDQLGRRTRTRRAGKGGVSGRVNHPPRLVIGGKLCCLDCERPYAVHSLRDACFRGLRVS